MNVLVYNFWKSASPTSAKEAIQYLLETENLHEHLEILLEVEELLEFFSDYCWILRDDPILTKLLNHPDTSVDLLAKLLYFGFGRYIKNGQTDQDFYFSYWASYLSSEKSLSMLLEVEIIQQDDAFRIHLLANLNSKAWEQYFEILMNRGEEVSKVFEIFLNIDRVHRNRLLYRNPTLYQYLRMVSLLVDSSAYPEFMKEMNQVLDQIFEWENYSKEMKKKFDIEKEKNLPPSTRDPKRLSCVLHDAMAMSPELRMDFLDYLTIQGVLLGESEREMIVLLLNQKM